MPTKRLQHELQAPLNDMNDSVDEPTASARLTPSMQMQYSRPKIITSPQQSSVNNHQNSGAVLPNATLRSDVSAEQIAGPEIKSEAGRQDSMSALQKQEISYEDPGFVSDIAERNPVGIVDYEADRENNEPQQQKIVSDTNQ